MATQPLSGPYPHQTEAVQAVLSAFESQDRAHLVMACGTGKTRVALWIAEALNARRIVIFVPSLALINQFMKEWLNVSQSTKKACLAVCSDETVTKNLDLCVLDPKECACPVTTNPKNVRQFLEKKKNQVQWIFCTYHSSAVLAEAMKDYPCDLGIFDEAHRTVNSEQFGIALIDEKVPIKKRLFMTATPKHYDMQSKEKKEDEKLVYSMDDESIYGPRAYTLPFRKAINLGLITDYKVIISVIDSPKTLTDDNFYSAVALALNKAFGQAPSVSKIVSFHRTIEDAKLFKEYLVRHEELKDFKALHVNGFLKTALRKQTMDLFKLRSKSIVTNARCLTEGIDVPVVDMVAFLNKKRSKIDIVQAIGRCLRKSPGKTYGYIFLPLFLANDQEECLEACIKRTDYREVWEVIQALSEQDEDLHATILDLKSNPDDRKALGHRLEKYIEIVSDPNLNGTHYQELKEIVSIKIIDNVVSKWDEMYAKLCVFKSKHGHCSVVHPLTTDKAFLEWVSRTRHYYKNNNLANHKVKLLESMEFELYPIDLQWENHFQKLKAYQKKHGHCNVPRSFDTTLSSWVFHQRALYDRAKLEEIKIQRLHDLEFDWDANQGRWDHYFKKLQDYKKQHGHCRVSCKSQALGSWVSAQRIKYKEGILAPHRIKLLNDLGVEWERYINQWQKNFEALKRYHRENGHCQVPIDHVLRAWSNEQRFRHRKGIIEKDRFDLLKELEFDWHLTNGRWQKNFDALKQYHEQHGHCDVPREYVNKTLATWVSVQRQRYKIKKMPNDQIELLNTLGFIWDIRKKGWGQSFEKLKNYKEIYGDCYVRPRHGNADLYVWCHDQRRRFKKNQLKSERIQLLDEIGFIWDPTVDSWDFFFNKLKTHFNDHGHCHLPKDEPGYSSLVKWLNDQIKLYKNGTLEATRIKLLEELKFSFQPISN